MKTKEKILKICMGLGIALGVIVWIILKVR